MELYQAEFEKLYHEHNDAIFRHLYYRLRDRDKALELIQEVFLKFWQYLSSGKTVEFPKAFLYRSAHNAFVNEIRTNKRTQSLESLSETGFEVEYSDDDKEEVDLQERAVAKLNLVDQRYRDILIMRYVDGLKVKEIAELLGQTENNISVRLNRGLKKLKQLYE